MSNNKRTATSSTSTLTTRNAVATKDLHTTSLHTRLSYIAENVKVYAYSDAAYPPQLVAWGNHNGFFSAIQQAYSQHYHLVLRPDDLWLTIAQGVSAHINHGGNAELYRDKFVAHQGKEEVVVVVDHVHWPECVDKLVAELSPRVKAEVDRILVCDFSTTTGVVRTASQVVLMYTLQTYFKYSIRGGCGIPRLTLLGTLADWEHVQEKVDAVVALGIGLDTWLVEFVTPIVGQFIRAYRQEDSVDEEFWSKAWKRESFGSGFPTLISGWLGHLYPYDSKGKMRPLVHHVAGEDKYQYTMDNDYVPNGTVRVPGGGERGRRGTVPHAVHWVAGEDLG
ncbi:hypothetical protein BC938DRAFT_483529 [Jimgerdemannia flammicorona]|uniref:Uncharacterized protein n=1 Tax=Jimgerdemannia flammicorona TaxID=994334 RepID=A0A433QBR2_9FUNG|nr:hypothetical protein BC938DRAFT_483529 [Jimgerdemannia flammicorona]